MNSVNSVNSVGSGKYVYTGGAYREFRGYVFAYGNPVTITDRGTLEAVQRDPTFRRIEDETGSVREEGQGQVSADAEKAVEDHTLHLPKKRGWQLGRPRK